MEGEMEEGTIDGTKEGRKKKMKKGRIRERLITGGRGMFREKLWRKYGKMLATGESRWSVHELSLYYYYNFYVKIFQSKISRSKREYAISHLYQP